MKPSVSASKITTRPNSWPTFCVTPLAAVLVKLVDLSPGRGRVTQVDGFHFLRLDDDDAEIRPRHRVFQILNLCSCGEVLVVVRLVYRLAWRRVLERA